MYCSSVMASSGSFSQMITTLLPLVTSTATISYTVVSCA